MRGGLDDALDKLARRDELRRRAEEEANGTGTPPAVNELVEAIAAVVARYPSLGVTVGVEGVGEPLVLRCYLENGVVQVTADSSLAQAATNPPRHADFDVEVGEPVDDPYAASRFTTDDQDRYGAPAYSYDKDSDTAERRYGSFDQPPAGDPRYAQTGVGDNSRDLGARMRDLGLITHAAPHYEPHPYAATPPPPVPPQRPYPDPPMPHAEPMAPPMSAPPMQSGPAAAPTRQRSMPEPLAEPIPLQVERPEQTEMAARRLAALLRDDPSLLGGPAAGE